MTKRGVAKLTKETRRRWRTGIKNIVRIARNAIEDNARQDMDRLIEMMRAHESQQSAPIVATIAILVGDKLKNEVKKEVREAVGDMILWDVPIIKSRNDWPQRKKFTPKIIYENDEERILTAI